MKRLFALSLLISIVVCGFSKKTEQEYNEAHRNQFHFSPNFNKMGSPIACIFSDSVYHLYFQYNNQNLTSGYYNWGYAVSPDLLHWEQKNVVLSQPSEISDSMNLTPWWGSVSTKNNSTRIWYNQWNKGIFAAETNTPHKISNRKLCAGTDSLMQSEPFVFWHQQSNKWVMVAYNRTKGTMHILNSEDGLQWTQTSSFNYSFGFPQLIEMPVQNIPNKTRWVLLTEKGTYMTGTFDGEKFEIKSSVQNFNHGRNIGGSIVSQIKNKHIILSEIKNEQMADLASNGNLSFPASIQLFETKNEPEIRIEPLKIIKSLSAKSYQWTNEKIYPGLSNSNILRRLKGEEMYIKGEIENINSNAFGLLLRNTREKKGMEFSVLKKQNILNLNNTHIEYNPENALFEFEILIDRSSIEVYIDGGKFVYSTSAEFGEKALYYEIFTSGGEIMIRNLEIHKLQSAWK
jgi:sucrose-6-phosphate hydrolase SacC (GH32 family)